MEEYHLIIDCGSTKTIHIAEILEAENLPWVIRKLDELLPIHYQQAKKILISGAPILLSKVDNQPYLEKLSFLRDINVPVFGICFGHQMLGLLDGGKVSLTTEARAEETIHQLIPEDPIFNGIDQNALFQEDHCESVSLPNGFIKLAESNSCDNECMKHKQKPWYGVQFHPEVTEGVGHLIIKNWLHLCS
ncbi:glutamine amidotransferase-related protein [Flammeovirga agarivorans]|uniref:Glutamine amidotransferase domain-containing protein n=1 Tax=Flammeovirga agarivorans TaxID=2726742 RepID=A0A7X8SHF3_9BACT|nr:hypothetical protein [Flammeovirga agarivorans]NLR90315.1 hypothetical protein [Flammeovirga agarivorans]